MLQLKNITKSYKTGEFTQVALDKVSGYQWPIHETF